MVYLPGFNACPSTLTFSYNWIEALLESPATAAEESSNAEPKNARESFECFMRLVPFKLPRVRCEEKTVVFCAGEVQIRWSLDWTPVGRRSYKNMHRKIGKERIASNNNLDVSNGELGASATRRKMEIGKWGRRKS